MKSQQTKSEVYPHSDKAAIRKRAFAKIREAYRKQPDTESPPDAWSNCDDFED